MMQYDSGQKTLITKDNAYTILKAFAKEYKKQNGSHVPTEIVIVGGGSILLNYGFREYTQDFDILVQSMEMIKSVSYRIADQYNLPNDWMNTDFYHTASYSVKLREVSKHFCSFNGGDLEIRTVNAEYLIAMKMVSAREYRNDISDIVGILIYLKKHLGNFSMDKIDAAIQYLYGEPKEIIKDVVYDKVRKYSQQSVSELQEEYKILTQTEAETRNTLITVNETYPDAITEDSIDSVIKNLRRKKGNDRE